MGAVEPIVIDTVGVRIFQFNQAFAYVEFGSGSFRLTIANHKQYIFNFLIC